MIFRSLKTETKNVHQSLSGKVHAVVDDLQKKTLSYAKGEKIENKVYPHQIDFCIQPHIDSGKRL